MRFCKKSANEFKSQNKTNQFSLLQRDGVKVQEASKVFCNKMLATKNVMQSNYRQIPFYLLFIFLIDRILLLKAMES